MSAFVKIDVEVVKAWNWILIDGCRDLLLLLLLF